MDVQELIRQHGLWVYVFTFVWTFFEGETFVVFCGFAAAQGLLNAPLLLISAWLGSFAGDQFYFWVGRHFGLKLLERRPAWRARVDKALAWLRRFDIGFILSFRFIYGVRNVSSFALGISGIDWRRFLSLNFIAAGLWAAIFVGAGYLFGQASEAMLGDLAAEFRLVMLTVFALVVLGVCLAIFLRRRRREKAKPDRPA
ncbi:MAG TPA: DedA family protein [Candidatus Binataceae bacterium]|nr:DedA family protein [Candidatus Binataceae bacterium]